MENSVGNGNIYRIVLVTCHLITCIFMRSHGLLLNLILLHLIFVSWFIHISTSSTLKLRTLPAARETVAGPPLNEPGWKCRFHSTVRYSSLAEGLPLLVQIPRDTPKPILDLPRLRWSLNWLQKWEPPFQKRRQHQVPYLFRERFLVEMFPRVGQQFLRLRIRRWHEALILKMSRHHLDTCGRKEK